MHNNDFQTGDFHSIGILVSMSITQGGSGYPFFAPSVYHYICGRDICSISPSLQEVPDHELLAVLDKVLYSNERSVLIKISYLLSC